jgi:hypothetical protein
MFATLLAKGAGLGRSYDRVRSSLIAHTLSAAGEQKTTIDAETALQRYLDTLAMLLGCTVMIYLLIIMELPRHGLRRVDENAANKGSTYPFGKPAYLP